MAERKIDYDRGVIINQHPASGMDVFMYVDDPGHFLNAHGGCVSDQIAQEAGYDIQKLSKDRVKLERRKQAMDMIDAEFSDEKDIKEEVVEDRDGYKVITTGLGRYHVNDPDGNRLTAHPVSAEIAHKLLDGMVPAKEEVKPKTGLKK